MDAARERASEARARMVADQLRGRDIRDERVLAAMGAVARDAFVPEASGAPRIPTAPYR